MTRSSRPNSTTRINTWTKSAKPIKVINKIGKISCCLLNAKIDRNLGKIVNSLESIRIRWITSGKLGRRKWATWSIRKRSIRPGAKLLIEGRGACSNSTRWKPRRLILYPRSGEKTLEIHKIWKNSSQKPIAKPKTKTSDSQLKIIISINLPFRPITGRMIHALRTKIPYLRIERIGTQKMRWWCL